MWFEHSTRKGGHDVVSLVKYLKNYDDASAIQLNSGILHSHPGIGSAVLDVEEDRVIERAEITQEIFGRLVDPGGTPAEIYLQSRGITGPLPDFVKYWPNARCGEGAVVGLLSARGRVVGLQAGYIDPDGRKSTIWPYRRRFALEKAPDAVFEIPRPNAATDLLGDALVTEGIEDVLSLAELGRAMRIVGLPGIGTLAHVPVRKGERIIVVRDGDGPGSPADRGLAAGVDHLLLGGATVKITCTPPTWTPMPSCDMAARRRCRSC